MYHCMYKGYQISTVETSTKLEVKALEIRYTLMDRYSVDISWLSEAFGGNII